LSLVLEVVDSGHPALAGNAPALLLQHLGHGFSGGRVETVGVENPVEVVELVLDMGCP